MCLNWYDISHSNRKNSSSIKEWRNQKNSIESYWENRIESSYSWKNCLKDGGNLEIHRGANIYWSTMLNFHK